MLVEKPSGPFCAEVAPASCRLLLQTARRAGIARRPVHDMTERSAAVRQVKIIVERHPDGYVAYPLGLKGVVVGEGNSYDETLADAKSAIQFHVGSFGAEVLEPVRSREHA